LGKGVGGGGVWGEKGGDLKVARGGGLNGGRVGSDGREAGGGLGDGVQADAGTVQFGHDVVSGYYAQEHEGLDPDVTCMESLRQVAKAPDDLLRGVLGHFLLGGDQAHQPTRTLSGGEKTKLALARLVLGRHATRGLWTLPAGWCDWYP